MPAEDQFHHFVRVTGRRSRFVEFDYAIGSPDLAVELIMPEDMFVVFCERVKARVIDAGQGQDLDRERAAWRRKVTD